MAEQRRPCKKCGRNRAERFFTSARGHTCSTCRKRGTQRGSRDQRLWETYGITQTDYDAQFAAQGGKCAICGGTRRGNLDIDHDHALEGLASLRGLLCRRCNRRLLPACKDTVAILQSAIRYLQDPPWKAVT